MKALNGQQGGLLAVIAENNIALLSQQRMTYWSCAVGLARQIDNEWREHNEHPKEY